MKLLQQAACGENRVALLDAQRLVRLAVQRDESLNYDAVVSVKIGAFHPLLKGYFAQTPAGQELFLRTDARLTEGETRCARITKEERLGKAATAEPTDEKPRPARDWAQVWAERYRLQIEQAETDEMDALVLEALEPRALFADGAALHIERTRACQTIDVDSGSSQKPFAQLNVAAVPEIARQIMLKNLSGMILIDFAGFKQKAARDALSAQIKQALEADERSAVLGWTAGGLLEIRRARQCACLWDVFCAAPGVFSPRATYYRILRACRSLKSGAPTIYAAPPVIALLQNKRAGRLVPVFDKPADFFEIKE